MKPNIPPLVPITLSQLSEARYLAQLGTGIYAYGTTPTRALHHLSLIVAWRDAPNGWRSRLAWWRLRLHLRTGF